MPINELTLSDREKLAQQMGTKSRDDKGSQSPEARYRIPGGFPHVPDSIEPDDSCSVMSQPLEDSRPPSSRLTSIAPSSSLGSRHPRGRSVRKRINTARSETARSD